MALTPQSVFEKLVDKALFRGCFAMDPDGVMLRLAIQRGKPIPEKCLPGRLLESLSEEERKTLQYLTSDMVANYRVFLLEDR